MVILPKHLRADNLPVTADQGLTGTDQIAHGKDAPINVKNGVIASETSDTDSDHVSTDVQGGVQKAQATTAVWSKSHLVLAYLLIFLIYFVDSMQQQITNAFSTYVTSSFQLHSLTAVTGVLSSIIGGLTKLPLAKVLDIFGRPQGFALMVRCLTIGLIMMAATENVKMYCAAQVFHWVGQNGIDYSLSIFIADTSQLKNRSLMFAFASSSYIVTIWIGGPAANSFLAGAGWRWGFGTFAIVTPVICSPLLLLFAWNHRKAKAAGLVPERSSSGRTLLQSVRYYVIEFDLLGLILIAGGLALFLLPFSLYSYQANEWASPMIICMLVFKFLLIISFALHEKYLAKETFIPWSLMTDRTVLGAYVLSAVLFVSFYIWDSYFYSFLLVVNNLSITHATYILNIYSIGACFWAIVTGVFIRWSGRFKPLALFFGVPVTMLGVGLIIKFRQPDVNIGYIVKCQIFIALAGGTLVICEQLAAMAATTQQYVAVVIAMEGMFSSVGGAIGSTVATAIWTSTLPNTLRKYLPADAQDQLTEIYGSIVVQTSYAVGTPTRDAINRAYGDAQRYILIASVVILHLGLGSIVIWRDINVKNLRQVKGTVV